jgi:hypothetical protein
MLGPLSHFHGLAVARVDLGGGRRFVGEFESWAPADVETALKRDSDYMLCRAAATKESARLASGPDAVLPEIE